MDQFSSNEIVKVKSVGEDGIPLKPIKRHKSKNSNSSSNSSQLFADGVHPSPGPEWVAEFAPWRKVGSSSSSTCCPITGCSPSSTTCSSTCTTSISSSTTPT